MRCECKNGKQNSQHFVCHFGGRSEILLAFLSTTDNEMSSVIFIFPLPPALRFYDANLKDYSNTESFPPAMLRCGLREQGGNAENSLFLFTSMPDYLPSSEQRAQIP